MDILNKLLFSRGFFFFLKFIWLEQSFEIGTCVLFFRISEVARLKNTNKKNFGYERSYVNEYPEYTNKRTL